MKLKPHDRAVIDTGAGHPPDGSTVASRRPRRGQRVVERAALPRTECNHGSETEPDRGERWIRGA
ncbi:MULTISPECIES: hypothetical protein [Natrialbaceae]|uniref:hypothetical protein n=1 Tax=Natrialbaceae TaxID=1644061 RepID=UPI00207D2FAF|nr:hypothetical protein [Natronococcus sp. CG52]